MENLKLKTVPTAELWDELKNREGVKEVKVGPDEEYRLVRAYQSRPSLRHPQGLMLLRRD